MGSTARKVGILDGYKATTTADGTEVVDPGGEEASRALKILKNDPKATAETIAGQQALVDWWKRSKDTAEHDKPLVTSASVYGGQMALRLTAGVPATMAVIYLLLILYFKSKGGYKAKIIVSDHEQGEMMAGGVEGPSEY